jgi:hypothetical protein
MALAPLLAQQLGGLHAIWLFHLDIQENHIKVSRNKTEKQGSL